MSATDPRIQLGPQVTGRSVEECQHALDALRPIVRVAQALDPIAAHAAAALVHLLIRLHPHTVVDGDAALDANPWNALTVADAVVRAPRAEAATAPRQDLIIVIGDSGNGDWYVGGDDWTAVLGDGPTAAGATTTGVGLHAAVALTAAEAMKLVLKPLGLPTHSAMPHMVWNLLDYRRTPAPGSSTLRKRTQEAALFGNGSVGSSAAAVLTSGEPVASIAAVDSDSFDPIRNPYRYPASTTETTGPKAIWVRDMLRVAGWDAVAHETDVATWVTTRADATFDGVAISSVDRIDARSDVADALAATTISVGVGGLAFHVEREHPDDVFACPFCQYLHVGRPLDQIDILSEQVGLDIVRVAALVGGERLSAEDVTQAIAAGRLCVEGADEMIGRRLEDLVRRAYAQAAVRTTDGVELAVSAPSVSWLAGAIAAAELSKAAYGLPLLDRRVDLDISGVPSGVLRKIPRNRSGRCLCASPFRRRAVRRTGAERAAS